MNRHRLPPLGYAMALAAMMQPIERPTPRVKPLHNVPDHRPNAKLWTCKRCGEKFTPHRSPTYCDGCQSIRMGEPQQNEQQRVTRDKARDAIRLLSMNQIPVSPYVLEDLFRIAEWPLPEETTKLSEVVESDQ